MHGYRCYSDNKDTALLEERSQDVRKKGQEKSGPLAAKRKPELSHIKPDECCPRATSSGLDRIFI
jgi:hypothetical protein